MNLLANSTREPGRAMFLFIFRREVRSSGVLELLSLFYTLEDSLKCFDEKGGKDIGNKEDAIAQMDYLSDVERQENE